MAPSRPVWVPVPILVRLRPCFAYAAATGLLAAVIHLLMRHQTGDRAPSLVILGMLILFTLTFALAILGFVELLTAFEDGPGDDMSAYGSGQKVEIVWSGKRREQGQVTLENAVKAVVGVIPPRKRDKAPSVSLRLDGRTHRVRCGPGAWAPDWYALVDESDQEIARAEAAPGRARGGLNPGGYAARRDRHRVAGAEPDTCGTAP